MDSAKTTMSFNNVQKVLNLPNLGWAQFCEFCVCVAAYKLRLKTSSLKIGWAPKSSCSPINLHGRFVRFKEGKSFLHRSCGVYNSVVGNNFSQVEQHVGVCYLPRTVTVSVLERASRHGYFSRVYTRAWHTGRWQRFNKNNTFFATTQLIHSNIKMLLVPASPYPRSLDPPSWSWFSCLPCFFHRQTVGSKSSLPRIF